MKRLKEFKGITLITLVITIVILIILVGITIATLTGNNGLIEKTKQAKEETQKAQATEKINLKITNMQIASWIEKKEMPTLQYIADGFCQDEEIQYVETEMQKIGSFLLPQIDASNLESIFVKLKEYPYQFEINKSLQLASINGVKIADNSSSSNSEQIDALKNTITSLQDEINSLKDEISDLKTTDGNIQNRVQTLENSSEISVTTINFTTPSEISKWIKIASYPTGYSKDNVIINGHFLFSSTHQNLILPYASSKFATLSARSDGIYMYINNADMSNKSGKLFLQKIN